MKHLDLFSGIGGAALAVDRVWPDSEHIFCDNDLFCQAVLKKHWPESKIFGDIRTLTNAKSIRIKDGDFNQRTPKPGETYILTGGFPCQPFSQAGQRKGKNDDRYLWDEMLRVIKEFRPTWIIGENVAGLLSMAQPESKSPVESETDIGENFNGEIRAGGIIWGIINDIEEAGYDVQTFLIPAVALNAPHRRDRVWIVGHAKARSDGRHERTLTPKAQSRSADTLGNDNLETSIADTKSRGRNVGSGTDSKTNRGRMESNPRERNSERSKSAGRNPRTEWSQNWLEVAARLCTLDDGLPSGLPRPRGWRNAALKGAGNAWVPQIAIEIMKAIKEIDI